MKIETTLTPAEIRLLPEMDLSDCVCVVFDVLRATSTMVTAIEHGVAGIYPAADMEEALALQKKHPHALLGGERKGQKIDRFDLGNSPLEYRDLAGREIISTTTNGTVALRSCGQAAGVIAASLLNATATADYLIATRPARVRIVCAGTGRRFALEDALGGGALLSALPETTLDDGAQALLSLWQLHASDPLAALLASANGRRLVEIGREEEVRWCAQLDLFRSVVLQQKDRLVRWRV